MNQYRCINWPTATHHLVLIYVTQDCQWSAWFISLAALFLAHCVLNYNIAYARKHHRDSIIPISVISNLLPFGLSLRTPKLFVMGFNRISTRESMRHMLLDDGQRPIHTNLFDNSLCPWNFRSTKATYVSLYEFQHIWFIDNYDYLSRVRVCTYPYILYIHTRTCHVELLIVRFALYRVIVESMPNLCARQPVAYRLFIANWWCLKSAWIIIRLSFQRTALYL